MKVIIKWLFLIFTCFNSGELLSQSYFIDSTFAEDEVIIFNSYASCFDAEISEVNDKILIAGCEVFLDGPPPFGTPASISALYRFQNCVGLDSSYGINGRIPEDTDFPLIEGYLFNDDGSAFLFGSKLESGLEYPYLGKIDTSGFEDSTFNVLTSFNYTLDIPNFDQGRILQINKDEDLQKLLCVGSYSDSQAEGIFYRYFNLDGSIDSSIYENGIQKTLIIFDFYNDNKITKAINIDNEKYLFFGVTENNYLTSTMVKLDGTIDYNYGYQGTIVDSTISPENSSYFIKQLFTEKINNSIYVGTLEEVLLNPPQYYVYETNIRKYNLNGQLDTSFGSNGKLIIAQQNNNLRIINLKRVLNDFLLVSYANSSNVTEQSAFIINGDGQVMNEFNFQLENSLYNYATLDIILDVAFTTDDKLLVLANLGNFEGNTKMVLMRLTQNSSIPNLSFEDGQIQSNLEQGNLIFQWYFDGTEIPFANTSNLEFQGVGEYVLNVYNTETCGFFSDTIFVDPVLISSIEFKNIKIYPNPTTSEINIDAKQEIKNIKIIDMLGTIVINLNSSIKHSLTINTKNLSQGIYNILINDKDSHKIIITNF